MHTAYDEFDLALFGAAWNRTARRNYSALLRKAEAFCRMRHDSLVRPSAHKFNVIVSEAYGPCNHPDHPEVDWEWYKRYNADMARIFARYPFAGLTLSNHAEPVFSLWHNADWHYQGNTFPLNSV